MPPTSPFQRPSRASASTSAARLSAQRAEPAPASRPRRSSPRAASADVYQNEAHSPVPRRKRGRKSEPDLSPPPQKKKCLAAASFVQPVLPVPATRPSSQAKWQALLAKGRAAQPTESQDRWEKTVRKLCDVTGADGDRQARSTLRLLLTLAPSLQKRTARHVIQFTGTSSSAEFRHVCLQRFARLGENEAGVSVGVLVGALGRVPGEKRRMKLLEAIVDRVPAASQALFLCAAESLLDSCQVADAKAVLLAAQLCDQPLVPRGLTREQREQQDGRLGIRRGAPVPPSGDEDFATMLQIRLWEEADEDSADERRTRSTSASSDLSTQDSISSNASEASDARLPYWHVRPESVQNASAVAAVKLIWKMLNDEVPRTLPVPALFTLVEGACAAVRREAQAGRGPFAGDVRQRLETVYPPGATQARKEALLARSRPAKLAAHRVLAYAFAGNEAALFADADHINRIAPIAQDNDFSYYLDEEGLTSRAFVAHLWAIIHRQRTGDDVDPARARQNRDNMRCGFFSAMVNACLLHVAADGTLSLERLCENGFSQRLIYALQGYENFSLDKPSPQELLSVAAAMFHRELGDGEEPTRARLLSFMARTEQEARQQLPPQQVSIFERDLAEYLRLTYPEAMQALQDARLA